MRAAQKGKDLADCPAALASLAARHVRSGRRLCGKDRTRDAGTKLDTSAKLFMIIKIAGACYLLWLGVQSIRSSRSGKHPEPAVVTADAPTGAGRSIRQGFLVGVANPKSIVSLMAILPQFVDNSLGHPTLQMLLIGIAGGIAQVLIETIWVCAAGSLRTWFQRRPNRIQRLKAGGGIAMIGLAGKLAIER